MQNHASRRVASDSLAARHPYRGQPFPKEIVPNEIAVAYGARCMPKLSAVLALPRKDLTPGERAHALRTFLGQCSNQESKASGVGSGAVGALVTLVADAESDAVVRQLSCMALASLCTLVTGRAALFAAEGASTLCGALRDDDERAREAAAVVLETVSSARDGAGVLAGDKAGVDVIGALITMVSDEDSTPGAVAAGIATLCNLSTTDSTIASNLRHHAIEVVLSCAGAALKADSLDFVVAALSAKYLRHLCHHPSGKIQVLEAGSLPTLAKMLGCFDLDVRRLAAGALMGLSVELDAKVAIAEAAGQGLVDLLPEDDLETAENALVAVQGIAEHPRAREVLEALLDEYGKRAVFGE